MAFSRHETVDTPADTQINHGQTSFRFLCSFLYTIPSVPHLRTAVPLHSVTHSSAKKKKKNHLPDKLSLNSSLTWIGNCLKSEGRQLDLMCRVLHKRVHSKPVDCFSCGVHHSQFFSSGFNFQKTYWWTKIAMELWTADLFFPRQKKSQDVRNSS